MDKPTQTNLNFSAGIAVRALKHKIDISHTVTNLLIAKTHGCSGRYQMRQWKIIVATILAALAIASCGEAVTGDETTARKAVLATLVDPASAKFGKFSHVGQDRACLTVNVKDSMGNYFGEQQAHLRRNIDGWSVIWSFVGDHDDCIEATQKVLSKSRSE